MRSRRTDILEVGVPVTIRVVSRVSLSGASAYISLGNTVVMVLLTVVGRGNWLEPVVTCVWKLFVVRPQVWHRRSWVNSKLCLCSVLRSRLLRRSLLLLGRTVMSPVLIRTEVTLRKVSVLLTPPAKLSLCMHARNLLATEEREILASLSPPPVTTLSKVLNGLEQILSPIRKLEAVDLLASTLVLVEPFLVLSCELVLSREGS